MEKTKNLGEKGEEIAIEYLKNKGFSILYQNWRYKHKEVDIIAEKGSWLVFAEVKTRMHAYLQSPREAVGRQKQRFLIQAANAYIEEKNTNKDIRFDVLMVFFQSGKPFVEHIEDAFMPHW